MAKRKKPTDRNRIVIEGLDDRLDTGERGRFHDRILRRPDNPLTRHHMVSPGQRFTRVSGRARTGRKTTRA